MSSEEQLIPVQVGHNGCQQTDIVKDSHMWFEDGNVVLVAQNSGFRVYKGALSRQSVVFKDLFALPQPKSSSDPEETFDGCPMVHLSDTSTEIREMLRAVFDGIRRDPLLFSAT